MAKLIKKSKCTFEEGHIIKKNKVVGIPEIVWLQLNKLELVAQQYMYLKGQPEYQAGPSLDGFERRSALKSDRPYVEKPDTPVIDERVAQAMAFIEETDAVNDAMKVNEIIDEYGELIDWCNAFKFIEGNCTKPIDTPELGNPLELAAYDIVNIIKIIVSSPITLED